MSDADGLLSVTGDIPQGSGSCAAKFVLLGRKPAADIMDQKNSSLCPFLSFFLVRLFCKISDVFLNS